MRNREVDVPCRIEITKAPIRIIMPAIWDDGAKSLLLISVWDQRDRFAKCRWFLLLEATSLWLLLRIGDKIRYHAPCASVEYHTMPFGWEGIVGSMAHLCNRHISKLWRSDWVKCPRKCEHRNVTDDGLMDRTIQRFHLRCLTLRSWASHCIGHLWI